MRIGKLKCLRRFEWTQNFCLKVLEKMNFELLDIIEVVSSDNNVINIDNMEDTPTGKGV